MKLSPKKLNVCGKRENFALGTQRNLYSIGSLWGFALGVTQLLCFALGVTQILAFLDINMFVYQTQNCGVGGLSQRQEQMQMVLHRSRI